MNIFSFRRIQKFLIVFMVVWLSILFLGFYKYIFLRPRVQASDIRQDESILKNDHRILSHGNIAYIKNIKCASETLTQMLYRFGISNNLSFVLPRTKKIYLGWPYQLQEGFYSLDPPPFNMLIDHSVFNATAFSQLLPKDTIYITSIREPFSHIKSLFNYYKLARVVNLTRDAQPMRTYFTQMEKFEKIYMSSAASRTRHCVPNGFSMTRDLMSFNLGLATGWDTRPRLPATPSAIASFLADIEARFSLVLIVEHFHESLILLKRLLQWSWRDIIFVPQNVGNYTIYKLFDGEDEGLRKLYREWSKFDHALYAHFNATLWRRIAAQGSDFAGEVKEFGRTLAKVREFCKEIMPSVAALRKNIGDSPKERKKIEELFLMKLPSNEWDRGFDVDVPFCDSLMKPHVTMLREEQAKHKDAVDISRSPVPPQKIC